jgi:hypothetical protein
MRGGASGWSRWRLAALLVLGASSSVGAQGSAAAAPALPRFDSMAELRRYLRPGARPGPPQVSGLLPSVHCTEASSKVMGDGSAGVPLKPLGPSVVTGLVTDRTGSGLGAAQVSILGPQLHASTDSLGRFRIVVPLESLPVTRVVSARARAIGYAPHARDVTLRPGDSIHVEFTLCRDINRLSEVTVSGAALYGGESITNTQHAGVDEGGIVKVVGDHLLVLRRGRLFTVALGDRSLKPVGMSDAFAPGTDPDGAWYDELLVHGDRAIVIGFSYEHEATELNLFRIGADGGIRHEESLHLRSNDYYSSRNYASRIVGGRLVMYAPLYLDREEDPLRSLPAMRKWPMPRDSQFELLVSPRRVFRVHDRLEPDEDVAIHTITTCDLASRPLDCTATALLGPPGEVFYASPTAVYVWMSEWHEPAPDGGTPSYVVRLPLDGSAPRALGVVGSPIDQFSFLEDEDGFLNVLVNWEGSGNWMWMSEWEVEAIALLRVPIALFGDGRREVPASRYRLLPAPESRVFHNRFVGRHLLYGGGNGWGEARAVRSQLFVVPWRGGEIARIELPHGVDRIEVLGPDAIVIGSGADALHFSGIRLGKEPAVAQQHRIPGVAQGELRSHGFFYRADTEWEGIIGLPIRKQGDGGAAHLLHGSASVVFLRNDGDRFRRLGELAATPGPVADDGCRASCVDWYGNARPIFLRGRVFALLGYEVVEGRISPQGITEVARVSVAPRR